MFKRKSVSVVAIVVLMLVIATVVNAAHVAINTDDGVLDSDWSNVSMLLDTSDSGDVANTNYDIGEVWVGNDAATPTTELYFRVDLEGLLNFSDRLEARLDCTGDNDFTDAQDIVVYYQLNVSEDVSECQGNLYASGCPFSQIEQNGATFGEEIMGSPNTYEWKANISGATNWGDCQDAIAVQFASLQNGSEIDVTDWNEADYSVPNSVTLMGFTSQPNMIAPATAVVLGLVSMGTLVILRRRK